MARLQKKNLGRPDERRPVGRGRLDVVELGDITIGRIAYQPGWRWSEDVRPIVGTTWCEVHHLGVVLSGHLHIEMEDGSSLELDPDDAFEVPPRHDAWVVGGEPWISLDSAGRRNFGKASSEATHRQLLTILLTDLVGSTELLGRLGDERWRDRLSDFNQHARAVLERFQGREVATTGDGFLAVFESPARATRAALALAESARELDLVQRAGLHTGEVERSGDDVRGIAVHLAARISASAGPNEVLVSATTRALLAGSGLVLRSRGIHQLKGIESPEELFAVEPPDSSP
jgi:class 3 adenylate cyclase